MQKSTLKREEKGSRIMKTFIYKLQFTSPVRFGSDIGAAGLALGNETCRSDTFFSALCIEWLKVFGESKMKEMVNEAESGRFLLSDLFPWKGQDIYLPKPLIYVEKKNINTDGHYFKKLKKIRWIPAAAFDSYINFLKEGGELPFDPDENKPWSEVIIPRASVARVEETRPYVISAYRFPFEEEKQNNKKGDKEGALQTGLYFILKTDNQGLQEELDIVLDNLGVTGIGGKKTTGLGKFKLAEEPIEFGADFGLYDSDIILGKMLNRKGKYYMALSTISPLEKELEAFIPEENFYTLIQRSGFVESPAYWENPIKRKPVTMFGAGSCFKEPLSGRILNLSSGGNHPVYRYGKGMYLGVDV